ncbi:MAG: Hint domain-containing protein [Pseudomonadota bacterium]
MFAWNTTAFESVDGAGACPTLDAHTTGIVAGTKVATRGGWMPVEAIVEGQEVLTFDGGLQTVIAVTRHRLMADKRDVESWPMVVPARALGNRDEMMLLPHQSVMIESDLAEELTGDPFALIPGASLVGFRGIAHVRPDCWVDVIQLHFAQDEIVFANIGALFLARAKADFFTDAAPSPYAVLPLSVADDLVDCLMADDHGAHHAPAPISAVA